MIIYRTINLLNDKFYVGKDSHNNPKYLGSGLLLEKAIKKYGKSNFRKEVLEYCSSEQDLNESEVWWIKYLQARKLGYNMSAGGFGGNTTIDYTKEQKKARGLKISKALKGKKKPLRSQEHRQSISKVWETRVVSQETKDKTSMALKGLKKPPMSMKIKEKISFSLMEYFESEQGKEQRRIQAIKRTGIVQSKTTKQKRAAKLRGRKQSKETIAKRVATRKANKEKFSEKV